MGVAFTQAAGQCKEEASARGTGGWELQEESGKDLNVSLNALGRVYLGKGLGETLLLSIAHNTSWAVAA